MSSLYLLQSKGKVYNINACIIQEELTKEEKQNLYTTNILKGVLYISSYLCSYMHKRFVLSILIRYNLLHYPPPFLCLVQGPLFKQCLICIASSF